MYNYETDFDRIRNLLRSIEDDLLCGIEYAEKAEELRSKELENKDKELAEQADLIVRLEEALAELGGLI